MKDMLLSAVLGDNLKPEVENRLILNITSLERVNRCQITGSQVKVMISPGLHDTTNSSSQQAINATVDQVMEIIKAASSIIDWSTSA